MARKAEKERGEAQERASAIEEAKQSVGTGIGSGGGRADEADTRREG